MFITNKIEMAGSRPLLYGISVSVAVIIALLSGVMTSYYALLIPAVVYLFSFGSNILSRYLACDSVEAGTSATKALIPTITVSFMMGLLYMVPAIIKPISAVIPSASENMKVTVGDIFYIFWAVLYGQIIAGGFSQIC